jgi:hypothetical protein
MSRTDDDIAAELAPAGLRFVERDRAAVRLPAEAAGLAPSCRRDEGRIDAAPDEVVDISDPARAEKLNAGWFRTAEEHGLFTADREFLLEVNYAEGDDPLTEAECAWVKVQLLDGWNIAGGTVPALGTQVSPEFTAMSVDEKALMRMTLWGNGTTSTLVVPLPSTVGTIRRWVERMTGDSDYPAAVQEAARAWLAGG